MSFGAKNAKYGREKRGKCESERTKDKGGGITYVKRVQQVQKGEK
jgi:hypothetical protein